MNRLYWVAGLMLALGLALVVGAGAYLVLPERGVDEPPPAPPPLDTATASDHPERWAAAVRPFVRLVERERGLDFEHPVAVDFLKPRQFAKQVTDDEDELTDEDRTEVRQSTGFLRALGLIGRDVDLFGEVQRLHGAGTVGYYSTEDQRIRIRGEELTPTTRSTLVHELTHALQDQHFDIGDRAEALEDAEEDDHGSASGAFQALVEGDASRIESAYVSSLSAADRAALDEAERLQSGEFRKEAGTVPPVLVTLLGAPYALGEGMLTVAVALDGDDAVDNLFEDPPTSDEHLLDPWSLLVDESAGRVEDVESPALEPGEEEFDSGTFGALGWYVVLAQRLDARTALRATDGWGGDAYSAFERDGSSCVRIAYRGDTPGDEDELADALQAWGAAGPATAEVRRDRAGLVFTSCDPGSADSEVPAVEAVLRLPVVRTTITAQVLEQTGSEEVTRCYVDRIVDTFTVEEITDSATETDPDVAARVQALAEQCAG